MNPDFKKLVQIVINMYRDWMRGKSECLQLSVTNFEGSVIVWGLNATPEYWGSCQNSSLHQVHGTVNEVPLDFDLPYSSWKSSC